MANHNTIVALPSIGRESVVDEIRHIAREQANRVFFLEHAAMRMLEREITSRQVMNVLRHGEVVATPTWSVAEEKGWKCSLRRITAGDNIEVVVKLVEGESRCLIVTTYRR